MGAISEKELVHRMQCGDQEAMRTAYTMYAGYLTAVCCRYVVDREDARDVLQEAFVKIFTNIDKYRRHDCASLKSWMARIVVNESLRCLQRNRKFGFIEQTDALPETEDDALDTDKVTFDVLHEMITRLPDAHRAVFNLFVFECRSHKAIAETLGITENNSASLLHRAKKMLAKEINQYIDTQRHER